MQILPVIDLMNGHVVRGVAGRRSEYKPVVSKLTTSTDPVDVALAFREHFGFNDLYLADLDAIATRSGNLPIYVRLKQLGFHLWIDAGITVPDDIAPLQAVAVDRIIVGLESIRKPEFLREILQVHGPAKIVFSVDLLDQAPRVASPLWHAQDGWGIARQALSMGITQLLILDLAQVGIGRGPQTLPLCRLLRTEFPQVTILSGGGVRNLDDLREMRDAHIDYVLIASALHDGSLTKTDVAPLIEPSAPSVFTDDIRRNCFEKLLKLAQNDCAWEVIPSEKNAALARLLGTNEARALIDELDLLDDADLIGDAGDVADEYWRLQTSYTQALVLAGPPAIAAAFDGLQSAKSRTRRCAAEVLGRLRAPGAFEALVTYLEECPDEESVLACVAALGHLGDRRAVDRILPLLQPPAQINRGHLIRTAAVALGEIGGDRAFAPLAELYRTESDWYARLGALEGLRHLHDPRAVEVFRLALRDENDNNRKIAEDALRELRLC